MAPRIDFRHIPHPRLGAAPVKARDQLSGFNGWLAVGITRAIGTMWAAYLFAALALVSLPAALRSHDPVVIVSWISQTFLQLVLLAVIMVGQNVLAQAADQRSQQTYDDAEGLIDEVHQVQAHLTAQDESLNHIVEQLIERLAIPPLPPPPPVAPIVPAAPKAARSTRSRTST